MKIILLVVSLSICTSLNAQTIRSQVDAYFAEVNHGSLSTGYLLNQGLFTSDQLAMFYTMIWRAATNFDQPLLLMPAIGGICTRI
jgi:hypothetical protein